MTARSAVPSIRPIGVRTLMVAVAVAAGFLWAIDGFGRWQAQNLAAARLLTCSRNLKPIGIAIWSYASDHGQFPPGTMAGGGLPPDSRLGWGAAIYPGLGREGRTFPIPMNSPWNDPRSMLRDPAVDREMICPERRAAQATATAMLPASFAAIAGLGPDAPSLPIGHPRVGMFGDDRRVTIADVEDGLANTAMIVETSAASGPWFAGGRATVRGVDPALKPYIGQGRPFGGNHVGGANVLMVDGSVRFMRESANAKVLEFMSTIAGGELPSDAEDDTL